MDTKLQLAVQWRILNNAALLCPELHGNNLISKPTA